MTATMASNLLSNRNDEVSDVDLLRSLLKSWFNRSRSTEPMVIGAQNEDAVLLALSQKSYVDKIYDCGLLESNKLPWLAASPDDIVVLSGFIPNVQQLAVVEVKTRVSLEKLLKRNELQKNMVGKLFIVTVEMKHGLSASKMTTLIRLCARYWLQVWSIACILWLDLAPLEGKGSLYTWCLGL